MLGPIANASIVLRMTERGEAQGHKSQQEAQLPTKHIPSKRTNIVFHFPVGSYS